MKNTILTSIILMVSALPVSAEIITVAVGGTVNSITTEGGFSLDGSVIDGSSMSAIFTYDTETDDQESGSLRGTYTIDSVSMTIGNYEFTHNPLSAQSPLFDVFVGNYVYSVNTKAPRFDGGIIYDHGVPCTFNDIDWHYTAMEVMNLWTSSSQYTPTDALPDSFPDISVFDLRKEFSVRFYQQDPETSYLHDGSFALFGEVTSLQIVPEPGTMLILGLGGLMLRRKYRR